MTILHITHSMPRGSYPLLWNILNSFKDEENINVLEVYLYDEKPKNHIGNEIFLNSKRNAGATKNIIKEICKLLKGRKVEKIITQRYKPSIIGAILSKKFNAPVFSIYHGIGEFHKIKRKLTAFLHLKKTTFIGVSTEVKNDLIKTCPSAKTENTFTICNAISKQDLESSLLTKQLARKVLGIDLDKTVIGCLGRLVQKKGYDTLLDAFKNLAPPENTIITILGEGKLLESLKDKAKSLGIEKQVFFLGHHDSASKYLKAFDLFIQPSRNEAFGLSAVEAIFSKVPTITSDAGGLPEVLGKEGLIFKAGNQQQLAEKIKTLLSLSEKERENYINILYNRATKLFELKAMQKSYRDLILNN